MDFGLLCFFLPISRKLDQFQPEQFLHTSGDVLCIALFPSCSWLLLFFAALAPLVRQAKPGRSCGLGGVHHVNSLFDM